MADTNLKSYLKYIESRLDRDAYTEVVAQCRHVLEAFPKYLEVYKLLARTMLAQEKYTDALDLFQRVLSGDPNDFIAHIGMSDCYRESDALTQAIWHLERAFEQVPGNADIENELKRVYAERDEKTPRKIQLTGGALARMYAKGKLYPQAISELKKAITNDPERLDLQTLLADVLWNSHQEVDAGKVAAEVLKRLPNSIEANRILAQLWLKAGKPNEAYPFLQTLKELDPYLGYEIEQRKPAPDDAYSLNMLQFTAAMHAQEVDAADWVSQLDTLSMVEKQAGVTGPFNDVPERRGLRDRARSESGAPAAGQSSDEVPAWIQDIESLGTGGISAGAAPEMPADMSSSSSPEDTPDWLQDVLMGETGPAVEPQPSAAPSAESDEALDWLSNVLQSEPEAAAAPPPADELPSPAALPTDTPAWLDDVLNEETGPPPAVTEPDSSLPESEPSEPSIPGAETPDWLQDILEGENDEGPAGPTTRPFPEAQSIATVAPSWLHDALSEDAGAVDEPLDLAEEEPTIDEPSDTPDWLGDVLEADSDSFPTEEIKGAEPPAVVSDDWLDNLLAGSPSSESGLPGDSSSLDPVITPRPGDLEINTEQLRKLDELETWDAADNQPSQPEAIIEKESVTPEEGNKVVPPNDDDQDIPDWLADGDLDSDDALAWLEDIAAKYDPDFERTTSAESSTEEEEEAEPAAPAEPVAAAADDDDLPDWLTSDDSEPAEPAAPPEPVAAVADDDDLPDWLKAEPAESAAPAEPAASPEPVAEMADDDDLPDWLKAEPAEPVAAADDDLPDWLRAEPAASAEATSPAEPVVAAADDDDLPDWLRTPQEPAPAVASDDLPDWLSEPAAPAEATAPAEPVAAASDEEDAFSWLDDQAAEQGIQPGQIVTGALSPDAPPVAAPPPPPPDQEAQPLADDELPDWLRDADAQIASAPEMDLDGLDIEVGEDELDWLTEIETGDTAGDDLDAFLMGETEPKPEPAAPPAPPAPEPVAEEPPAVLPPAPPAPEPVAEEPPAVIPPAPPAPEPVAEEPPAVVPPPAPTAPRPSTIPVAVPSPGLHDEEPLPDWLKAPEETVDSSLDAFLKAAVPAEPKSEAAAPPPPPPPVVAPPTPAPAETPPPPPPPAPVAASPVPPADVKKSTSLLPEYRPPAAEAGQDYASQLNTARQQANAGNVDAALDFYEGLIGSGQLLDETISDLGTILQTADSPRVYRLLGDALSGRGQLDEALEYYRQALDTF